MACNETVKFQSECGQYVLMSTTDELADTVDRIVGYSEIPEDKIDEVKDFILLGFIASIPWTLAKLGGSDANN